MGCYLEIRGKTTWLENSHATLACLACVILERSVISATNYIHVYSITCTHIESIEPHLIKAHMYDIHKMYR